MAEPKSLIDYHRESNIVLVEKFPWHIEAEKLHQVFNTYGPFLDIQWVQQVGMLNNEWTRPLLFFTCVNRQSAESMSTWQFAKPQFIRFLTRLQVTARIALPRDLFEITESRLPFTMHLELWNVKFQRCALKRCTHLTSLDSQECNISDILGGLATQMGESNFRYTRISNNLRNNPPIYKFSNILVPYADMVPRDRIHELAQ